MKIKYDSNLMHYMNIFENVTGTRLRDCFMDRSGLLMFVVEEKELGRAIGKGGFKARLIEKKINRKIKIVEFNPDPIAFLKNIVYPVKLKAAELEEKRIVAEASDHRGRGLLIGRAAENLRNFEDVMKRYFDIEEIKVL